MKPEELWFNTPDTETLCRAGGNGPDHPSQLYAIKKYVFPLMDDGRVISFLDYGCGSGTTIEAMSKEYPGSDLIWPLNYLGVDIIPKNIKWCRENFKGVNFEVNPSIHKIDQPDKSFDVVYSRHVVDHMKSFEDAMDEHKRVSKDLVIVILWTGLVDGDHQIKNIVDHRGTPKEATYKDEYTNNYSRKKVEEYLAGDPKWKLLELAEGVGKEVQGWNTVIVLRREA